MSELLSNKGQFFVLKKNVTQNIEDDDKQDHGFSSGGLLNDGKLKYSDHDRTSSWSSSQLSSSDDISKGAKRKKSHPLIICEAATSSVRKSMRKSQNESSKKRREQGSSQGVVHSAGLKLRPQ